MGSIIEVLISANSNINGQISIPERVKYKKHLDNAIRLLIKGYGLDDDYNGLIKQYKIIGKVPDAKTRAGKFVTNLLMTELAEIIYPKIPKDHGFLMMTFKFGEPAMANYISNGDRKDMIKALRNLADNLEGNKTIKMPHDN